MRFLAGATLTVLRLTALIWARWIHPGVRAQGVVASSEADRSASGVTQVSSGLGVSDPAKPATVSHRALRVAVPVVLVLLACGCAGHNAASPAANGRAASSAAPTATPMTGAELAWVTGITKLHNKIDKAFAPRNMTLTRAKLIHLGTAAGSCSRKLHRMGSPGTRLQRVYQMVKKACRTYDKAARCFARAARAGDAAGATVVGTPQDRIMRRSMSCGFAAQGNASNRLGDAQAEAELIESQAH